MTSELIYNTVKSHLIKLQGKMLKDFKKNCDNKSYNWILERFNQEYIRNMVFVSSFESKYGNMFENIAVEISKITYGVENVPSYVKGYGVTDSEFDDFIQNLKKEEHQYIVTKFDYKKNAGVISDFVNKNRGSGKGKTKQLPTMKQEKLKELYGEKWSKSKISKQPVDLIIKDEQYNLIEIKAGGNLDSSNAPGNIQKMMKFYYSLNKPDTKLYFATLYNYKGENNKWTGGVTSFLSEDMLLISKDFWNYILPENISFTDFKEIYFRAFDDLEFNYMLEDLLSN